MKKLLPLFLGLVIGCKSITLRDTEVYKNEISFFQMALEQQTELLEQHLLDGSCTCENGVWTTEVCETSAFNVLVIQHRLQYHVDLMHYNANLSKSRPSETPPEVPESSTLCPE